jgi:carbon storage regulator CsrA
MLVLSRNTEESIIIECEGVQIGVTVVSIDRGKVKIGFTAPEKVKINRLELWRKITAQETPCE